MNFKPVAYYTGSSAADNAVLFQITLTPGGPQYNTFQFGSAAGAIDVFGSGDGTTYLADPVAMIDLTSTTPSTLVIETTAGKHFGIRGQFKALRFLQKGATGVTGAYLTASES